MKIRRIAAYAAGGALALVGVAVLAIAGVILFDMAFPAQRVTDFTNVTYTGQDGATRHAYVVRPEGTGPHPAILLIHEFFGLNEEIVKKADLLAKEGYVVLAVDAYGNRTTRLVPRAILLVATTPQARISANVDAGFRYLAGMEDVDPGRIAAVGFCFGGTQVMRLGTRNGDLAAAVIFYGSGPITDPDALGALGQSGPVLGIFGQEDGSIPLGEVRGFEAAMAARGIRHQVTVYPGVGHAFVHADNIMVPGAAQQAWAEMLGFLDEAF